MQLHLTSKCMCASNIYLTSKSRLQSSKLYLLTLPSECPRKSIMKVSRVGDAVEMREALKTAALVLAVAQAGTSIHGDPIMFQRIFAADGVTVTGNFTLYNNYSRIRSA